MSLRIASHFALPVSTVVTMPRRLHLNCLPSVAPLEPLVRYEHAQPGTLLHLDMEKLGLIQAIGHRIHGDPAARARNRLGVRARRHRRLSARGLR